METKSRDIEDVIKMLKNPSPDQHDSDAKIEYHIVFLNTFANGMLIIVC